MAHWQHPEPPYHLFEFSEGTLRALLAPMRFEPIDVVHRHSSLRYRSGPLRVPVRPLKRLLYSAAFGPVAMLGPWLRAGGSVAGDGLPTPAVLRGRQRVPQEMLARPWVFDGKPDTRARDRR